VSGTDGFLMRRRTSRAGKSIKDNCGFGANLEARASAMGRDRTIYSPPSAIYVTTSVGS
jgi:hypothetical protein